MIDGSIVKAHQHSSGARKFEQTGIGKSVAGNISKIHIIVDSHGNPVDFGITGGEVDDSKVATKLIERTPKARYPLADKGYDAEYIRWVIESGGSTPVIPRKSYSKIGNDGLDKFIYKQRHKVENVFAKLNNFRSIATRYDKLKRNFEGILYLAFAYI